MIILEQMLNLLMKGESFALAIILSRSGSAPRAAGTRMIIRSDGTIFGTIGGGVLEARVQELAREVLTSKAAVTTRFVLSAQDAAQMGMICGGQMNVLVRYVDGMDAQELEFHKELAAVLKIRKRAWLITGLPAGNDGSELPKQVLFRSDGSVMGAMSRERTQSLINQSSAIEPQVVEDGGELFLVEPLCYRETVAILGAGHIGHKLAVLTKFVGFRTLVMDDRAEFATRERFESADEVIILDSFERALDGLDIDDGTFLVIVTRGHVHDKTVLAQALRSKAGYIGMIGSRRKRDAIYGALEKEGFSRRDFERVYCPIGLNIGAETPEEIAVSIVAELIQARARKNQWRN